LVILVLVKTAISIPDSLFDAAEKLAKRLGISRSELFQRAVRSFLQDNKQEGITESLNTVYEKQDDRVGLDPVLEHLQGASLVREDW
jgi:metal-responsive CopG/Arc/MetJ family transcriptional regulator